MSSSDTPPPGVPPIGPGRQALDTPEAAAALGGPPIKFPTRVGQPQAGPPRQSGGGPAETIGRPADRLLAQGKPRERSATFDGPSAEQIGASNAIRAVRGHLSAAAQAIANLDATDAILPALADDPIGQAQAKAEGFDAQAAQTFVAAVRKALDAHKPPVKD